MKKILELTKNLIKLKTTPDNPLILEEALDLAIQDLKKFTIERFDHNNVKSVLVYNRKKRPKKFKIILNGHIDVVAGKEYQYTPKVVGNKLYGVGSMDMKASVAALVTVFKDVADTVSYPLGLQLVTDEEIGGFDGTKYQVDMGVRSDFVLAGEPTNFDIVYKAKGILIVRISTKGTSAHGAYPWRGKNSIWAMNKFLNSLEKKYPIPKKEEWVTTVNVSMIETSNTSLNKVPDDCTISLDIRFVEKNADSIIKNLKKIMPKGFKLTILENEPALQTAPDNMYIQSLKQTCEEVLGKKIPLRGANGTSDARHFARVNCPGIEFGPIGGDIGGDNEWADIPSMEKYYQILRNFLLSH